MIKLTSLKYEDVIPFWDAIKCSEIETPCIAYLCCDWLLTHKEESVSNIVKIIQRLSNVTLTGKVDSRTTDAINNAPQEDLFNKIKQERIFFVHDIVNRRPGQIKFLKGWLNRINSFKFTP